MAAFKMHIIITLLSVLTIYGAIVSGSSTPHTTTTPVRSVTNPSPTHSQTTTTTIQSTVSATNDHHSASTNTPLKTTSAPTTKYTLPLMPSTLSPSGTQRPRQEGALTEAEELAIIVTAVVIGTAVAIVLVALISRYFLTSKTLSQEQKQKFQKESMKDGLRAVKIEMNKYDTVEPDSQCPSTSSEPGQ